MQILITNNHLNSLGGTETYTHTLIGECLRKNYNVDVLTFETGSLTNKLISNTKLVTKPSDEYDLLLITHSSCMKSIKGMNIKGPKIFTSHGIKHKLERPQIGADYYVSISKEIQYIQSLFGFESTIIRNGIDCHRFLPKNKLNKKLTNILCLCQSDIACKRVAEICAKMKINVVCLNKYNKPIWNIEDYINESDLVIGLGRGAYEAMACGRPVIVYDEREYNGNLCDGLIKEDNIYDYLTNNCSGRAKKRKMTNEKLMNYFNQYSVQLGEFSRSFAYNHLNIESQFDKYLNLLNTPKSKKNYSKLIINSISHNIKYRLKRELHYIY